MDSSSSSKPENKKEIASTRGIFDVLFDSVNTQNADSNHISYLKVDSNALQDAFQETFNGIPRSEVKSASSSVVEKDSSSSSDSSADSSTVNKELDATLHPPTFSFHYRLPNLPPSRIEDYAKPELYDKQEVSIPFPSCTIRLATNLETIEIRRFQIAILADQTCTLLKEGELEVTTNMTNPNLPNGNYENENNILGNDLVLPSERLKKLQQQQQQMQQEGNKRAITFYIATNYRYPSDILLPVLSSTSTSSQRNAWNTMQAGEFFTSETKQKKILQDVIFSRGLFSTPDTSTSSSVSYPQIWQNNLHLFLLCMFPTTKFHTLPISTYKENILKEPPPFYATEMSNTSLADHMSVYKRRFLVKRVVLHDDIYKNMLMRFIKDQFMEATLQIVQQEKASSESSDNVSTRMPITSYKDVDWVDKYLTSRYRLLRRDNVQTEWLEDAAWAVQDKTENVDLTKRIARIIPILPENYRIMRYLNARPYLDMISHRDSSLQKVQDVIYAKRKVLERAYLPNWAHDFLTGQSSTAFINLCNLFALFGYQNMQWKWSHPCLAQLLQSVSKLESEDVEFVSARRALQSNSGMKTYRDVEREREKNKTVEAAKSAALLKATPEKRTEIIDGKKDSQPVNLHPEEKQYLALLLFLNYLVYQTEKEIQTGMSRLHSSDVRSTEGIVQSSTSAVTDPSFQEYVKYQLAYMPFSPCFLSTQSPVVLTLQLDLIDATQAFIENAAVGNDAAADAAANGNDRGKKQQQQQSTQSSSLATSLSSPFSSSSFLLSRCQTSRIHIQNHQLYSNDIMAWYPKDHFLIPQLYIIGPTQKKSNLSSTTAAEAATKGIQWLTGSMYGSNESKQYNKFGGAVVTKKEQQLIRQLQHVNNDKTKEMGTSVDSIFSYGNHVVSRPTLSRIYYIYQFLLTINVHNVLSVKDSYGSIVSAKSLPFEMSSTAANAISAALAAAAAASSSTTPSTSASLGMSRDVMVDTSILPFPTGSYSSAKRNAAEYWNSMYPWKKLSILPGTGSQYSDSSGLNYESLYRSQQMNDLVDFKRKKMEEVSKEIMETMNEFSPAVFFFVKHHDQINEFSARLENMVTDPENVRFFNDHKDVLQRFLKYSYENVSQKSIAQTRRLTSELNAAELLTLKNKRDVEIVDPKAQLVLDLTHFTSMGEPGGGVSSGLGFGDNSTGNGSLLVRFDHDCIQQKTLADLRASISNFLKTRLSTARISIQDGVTTTTLSAEQLMTNVQFQDLDHFMHLVDLSGRNENEIAKLFSLFAIVQNYCQLKDILDECGNAQQSFHFTMKKWFLFGPLFSLNKKVFGGEANRQSMLENSLRDIIQTMFINQSLVFSPSGPNSIQIKEQLLQQIHFLMERAIRSAILATIPMIDMQTFLFSLMYLSMIIRGRANFHEHVIKPSNAVVENYEKAVLQNAEQLREATKYERALKTELSQQQKEKNALARKEEQDKKKVETLVKEEEKERKREERRLRLKSERREDRDKDQAEKEAKKKQKEDEKLVLEEEQKQTDETRIMTNYPLLASYLFPKSDEQSYPSWHLTSLPVLTSTTFTEKLSAVQQRLKDVETCKSIITKFLKDECKIPLVKPTSAAANSIATAAAPSEKATGPTKPNTAEQSLNVRIEQFSKYLAQKMIEQYTDLFYVPTYLDYFTRNSQNKKVRPWGTITLHKVLTELASSFMNVPNGPVKMTMVVDDKESNKFTEFVSSFKKDTAEETKNRLAEMKTYIQQNHLQDPWLRMFLLLADRKPPVLEYSFQIDLSAADGVLAANLSKTTKQEQQKALEANMLRFLQQLMKFGFKQDSLLIHVQNWICSLISFMWNNKIYSDWMIKQLVFLVFMLVLLEPSYMQSLSSALNTTELSTASSGNENLSKMTPRQREVLQKIQTKNKIVEAIRDGVSVKLRRLYTFVGSDIPRLIKMQACMYNNKSAVAANVVQWLCINNANLTVDNSQEFFHHADWKDMLGEDFFRIFRPSEDVEGLILYQEAFLRVAKVIHRYWRYMYDIQNGDDADTVQEKMSSRSGKTVFNNILKNWRDAWISHHVLRYQPIVNSSSFFDKEDKDVFKNIITYNDKIQPTEYGRRMAALRQYLSSAEEDNVLFSKLSETAMTDLGIQESAMYGLSYMHQLDQKMFAGSKFDQLLSTYEYQLSIHQPYWYESLEKRYKNIDQVQVTSYDSEVGIRKFLYNNSWKILSFIGDSLSGTTPDSAYVFQTTAFQLFMNHYAFDPPETTDRKKKEEYRTTQQFADSLLNVFLDSREDAATNAGGGDQTTANSDSIRACISLAQTLFSQEKKIENEDRGDLTITNNLPTFKMQTLALSLLLHYLYV